MSRHVTSAVFDNQIAAEGAVAQLRSAGVSDRDISLIAQHDGETAVHDGRGDTISDGGSGIAKGVTVGAGVGALAGLAALVIPGIGPFIAAGALTSTLGVAGASVATGALAGAATGGIAGALTDYGVSHDDATYYTERMGSGGVVVTVDLTSAGMDETVVADTLFNAGGHSSSRTRSGSMSNDMGDVQTTRTTTTTSY